MKILDCTIRDGGYYTNWDFSEKLIETYLTTFNSLPIDYLEVGYRSRPMKGYLGKYFYCPIQVLDSIKLKSSKKIAIILNEKDVRVEDLQELLLPIIDYVDMVRIAIDPVNFGRALKLAEEIKMMGFEVAFNVMYMSDWGSHKEFLGLVKNVDGIADYLYMVDSFGGVYPEDVKNTIDMLRSRTNTMLGFHGHNNLELALINTLTAIESGIDIVDATVTGMGRGAGNLKTELLLTALHSKGILDFPYNELSKSVDGFSQLQENYKWGTNLPYMVSGANSLPQKQVMEWVSNRYYSFNSIIRALNNQSQGKKDNENLQTLNFDFENKFKTALLVGGGSSAIIHADAIEAFLADNPDLVVIYASSKNAMSFNTSMNEQFFCLVGNEGHRLEEIFGNKSFDSKCVLPPYPRTMGTYIPKTFTNNAYELKKVSFTKSYLDSHTAIALQTSIELGCEEIFVIGYDGYNESSISIKEQELFLENQKLFSDAKKKNINLQSLTPTRYDELEACSIYSKI